MNYNVLYETLVIKAKSRQLDGYTERHHIVPRCMGGTDYKSNIVRLTPEEHRVAHLLLVKMYPNNPKLVFAADLMRYSRWGHRTTNKTHGWLNRKRAEACSIRNVERGPASLETKLKMSKTRKGRRQAKEHSLKIGLALKGRRLSFERCAQISDSRKGLKLSESWKTSISDGMKRYCSKVEGAHHMSGRRLSDETKLRMSNSRKGKPWSDKRRASYETSKSEGSV